MATLSLIFVLSFGGVFFRAFQQRNVMGLHYLPILPCSIFMEGFKLLAIYLVVTEFTVPNVLAAGLGGGLGAMVSMWVHNKVFR